MMLAALALIVPGSLDGLCYEHIPGSPKGLRYERAADLVIRGTVVDQTGLPVPRALVYIDGTQTSTETDDAGRFSLALMPVKAGTLTIFRDGFSTVTVPFDPLDPLTLERQRITLVPAPITDTVTVTAPRAPSPPASGFAMRPLDVVRTPGAAADLMRALQTLPGVAQIDEGAGLYVRGGDTSEVLVLLDDAVVFHPYRSETPGGGLFGSVEPFLLDGVSFATGGFSAKYGNALSAVLDMRGLRRPDTTQMNVTVGLAGASTRAALPIGKNAGIRMSGNRSFPGLLFAVNGRPYEFNPLPGGWDVNASAHYDSPTAGHFKAFVNALGDSVGVGIEPRDTPLGRRDRRVADDGHRRPDALLARQPRGRARPRHDRSPCLVAHDRGTQRGCLDAADRR
jgi:Carboxypeptidase regulatory-like domain/TonB-dependent Receptor Plug Domain